MARHTAALLADPAPAAGRLLLTGGRIIGGGGPPREGAAVLVADGLIERVGSATDGWPADATVIDLGGRTLLPGLVDVHAHLVSLRGPVEHGAEPELPGTAAHLVAASMRQTLRMGITTVRDVGSFAADVATVRQAQRFGASRGPRILTCGRIVSATAPGGRFFDGMYREADGADELRKAVREQFRVGADFIKVMTTGARSVELEDPDPAQLTREEVRTIVDEAHRMGYRVAAHCEGLEGTAIAIEEGVDTIEHGMYLNQRPDLLERMAAADQVLVPTFSCFYGVLGIDGRVGRDGPDLLAGHPLADPAGPAAGATWAPILIERAEHNLEQAERTLLAARAAGVRLAMGFDWLPHALCAIELVRMAHHGLTTAEAIFAATAGGAYALGLEDTIGRIAPGVIADLVVVDGNPIAEPTLLLDPARIWLVVQLGAPVGGRSLEADPRRA